MVKISSFFVDEILIDQYRQVVDLAKTRVLP